MTLSLWLIRLYQRWISPLFQLMGAQCRFHPTCSVYAADAFANFPWSKALGLSICRVCCCHPWHPGGLDPIPLPYKESHET